MMVFGVTWYSSGYDVYSLSIAMELPLFIIKGANRASLQPPRDAVEVEGVIADAPSLIALLL